MQKLSFETQEMDLSIQWSLITRIRAAANAYKSNCAGVSTDSLKSYLSALESLAEYVATRCRGSALFDEIRAAGQQRRIVQPVGEGLGTRARVHPIHPEGRRKGLAAAGDVSYERLVG